MFKKFVSVFIVLALLVCMSAVTAFATEDENWVEVRSGWGFDQEYKKGASNFRFTEEDFDIEFGENQYVIDRPVTIDFNGRNATHIGSDPLFVVESELTISNGTVAGGRIVVVNNGTFLMGSGKLTGNESDNGGALYVDEGGTAIINGGEISGNSASECGGGIYVAPLGNLYLNGGLITDNHAYSGHPAGGWGGGGIYTAGNFIMTGGTITGNTATENGGGINTDVRSWAHLGSTSIMGGDISNNTAGREGGGIYFGWNATVTGATITGNSAYTDFDWGGGGIMVQTGVTLYMTNAVVTSNTAEGFGGGVAGCPSGQIKVFTISGAAIYGNTANGTGLTSRDESDHKTDDQTAAASELFMNNGYADFYCENDSIVYGDFLGGGDANWSGSCDSGIVNINDGYYAVAADRMGLTANPSDEDINRALSLAQVLISDNYSSTHGGGIMCNGIIVFGTEVPGTLVAPGDEPSPTPEPSEEPTPDPSPEPSEEPSPEPTPEPTPIPTIEPTVEPSGEPAPEPIPIPTEVPTPEPTPVPAPPTPELTLPEPEIPLDPAPPEEEEILEEEIPLDAVPMTGDNTKLWIFLMALSGCGLIILLPSHKKHT